MRLLPMEDSNAQYLYSALTKILARNRRVANDALTADSVDTASAARALAALENRVAASQSETLCEYEVKALLRACGIGEAQETLCTSVDEALAAAQRLGYPVALKIQSPQIAHKSEIGGVKLAINSAEHLRAEGLSNTFVEYMKIWKGFVKDNDGFIDNELILNS